MTGKQIGKVIVIKNKDIPLLQAVFHVMQDICALEKQRIWERERMCDITQHLTWTHGGGAPTGLDAAYAALSEIEDDHKEKIMQYKRELKAAERILNEIPNRNMRTFVNMMYVMNIPPEKVRVELNMTEWGFRRAREAVEQARDMQSVKWRDRYMIEGKTRDL